MRADLHVHTTASDGRWTPERLIAEVTGRSIGLFAVTDHETIANVGRTETLAREAGVAFLRGVEILCYHPHHDEAATRFCLDWCDRHDLLVTGGSDCHGGIAGRELGVPVVDTADLRLGRLEKRILLGEAPQ